MIDRPITAHRRDLGDFLRTQRQKLSPADAGLSVGPRRRTPGLRREEVAQLSGLSTTWYTWIEQGRNVSMSSLALSRLAAALRLARAERAYLFELAGKRDPEEPEDETDDVTHAVCACVDAIGTPAYVLDREWNARAWNRQAERLFPGWLSPGADRNLLRFIFLEPGARALIDGWNERARRVVAEFRAHAGSHLNDAALQEPIGDLLRQSPAFARLWQQRDVMGREGGERTFNHPLDGFLRYEQVTFNLASRPGMKLTVLVGAGIPADGVASDRIGARGRRLEPARAA